MDPVPVDSTLLLWVLYLPEERRLRLKFRSGELYDYSAVPETIYQALLAAESKGRFFNHHIRDTYPTQRLGTGSAT
jgi:KTSC domain